MKIEKQILLSFDIEEFDTPLEYGKKLDLEEQLSVSFRGMNAILQLLKKYNITATFFTTANFALHFPAEIKKMSQSYEIASHGFYHSSFKEEDLLKSRLSLEKIIGKNIYGYRMARMAPIDGEEIRKAGYVYNASLHPTFIPGRYNNLDKPRTYFMQNEVLQIPAAVTPIIRFPLFWLSFKNFPLSLIKRASKNVMKKDGYVNLYFHPWEFSDTTDNEKFGLPFYVRNNGKNMLDKLEKYINWCIQNDYTFSTYYDLYKAAT
jgi:peptidoglycan/xylan/chitin deacetylase (PgdA/CDA1 family)